MISWYNNSVKKRGDIQKDIKKDDRTRQQLNDHLFKKTYIYNIEENGGKPQNIYIRPYYNLIGAKKKMEKNRIVKSWELKAASQKSFYKQIWGINIMVSSLRVDGRGC